MRRGVKRQRQDAETPRAPSLLLLLVAGSRYKYLTHYSLRISAFTCPWSGVCYCRIMCLGGTTTLVCSPERFSTLSRAGTIMRNRVLSNAHTLRRVMAVLMLIPLLAACSMSNLPV